MMMKWIKAYAAAQNTAAKLSDARLREAAACTEQELMEKLGTAPAGLTEEQAEAARETFGANRLARVKRKSGPRRLLEAFADPFSLVLLLLAVVSALTDVVFAPPAERSYTTVVIITVMVVVSGVLRFVQETRSSNVAEKLTAMIHTTACIERDGVRFAVFGVMGEDESYKEEQMKSNQTEAYFLRALSYFYLVRNFRDVPLITEPYIDDQMPTDVAKSSESEVIAQIKKDITDALATNAAKETYTEAWENKGRATKWALYALMADVCLWSEDYDGCITYADNLINATASIRPVFMSSSTQWFSMFYPGNSNESIFEIQFEGDLDQTSGGPTDLTYWNAAPVKLYFSETMTERLQDPETRASVRGIYGTFGYDKTATTEVTSPKFSPVMVRRVKPGITPVTGATDSAADCAISTDCASKRSSLVL